MVKQNKFIEYEILEMLKSNLSGVIITNIIAMMITVNILYSYLPSNYLIVFSFLHIFLALFRLYIGKQLFISINSNHTYEKKYLILYAIITSTTALSYGTIAFIGILYTAPDINIFIIGIILTTISTGALTTLANVRMVFLSFILFGLVPFMLVLLFHGGSAFYFFAIILLVYIIVNFTNGHRMYLDSQSSFLLKEKFKTIFDNSFDGIALIKNKNFIECNQSFVNMFGYTSIKDFLNTDASSHMPPVQDDGKNSMKKMLQMRKKTNQGTHTFEWKYLKKNGDTFYAEVTLSLIFINNEKVIYGIWRDITYSKEIQDEIVSLNKNLQEKVQNEVAKNREKDKAMIQQSKLAQMGEMIAMIAHQWRQPLSAVSATANDLILKIAFDNYDEKYFDDKLKKITDLSQHLSKTIDDFRGFYKEDKERTEVLLSDITKEVLKIVSSSIESNNINIRTDLQGSKKINTYSNELKQVLLNIIKNAEDVLLEKNVENPSIHIRTYDNVNHSYLEVSDNGGGIPEDIIDKICDPYFSTKTKKDGTGLGLYMSKTIIEEHCNGKLIVANNNDGAKFTIIL